MIGRNNEISIDQKFFKKDYQMRLIQHRNFMLSQVEHENTFKITGPGLVWKRVPRGSVVKCLTRNPGVLGSSLTGSSGFFRGSVLGQDTSEPSLVLVKPRKA